MAFGRSKDQAQPAPSPRAAPGTADGSLIAPGMVLDGDCEASGALRVDGHITGDVRASRLTIGPEGRVDGDVRGVSDGGSAEPSVTIEGTVGGAVHAPRAEVGPKGSVGAGMNVKEAVVRGRVMGGIQTEKRLILEETAVVEGDVTAHRLGLREGGQVFGTIRIGTRPGPASSAERAKKPTGPGSTSADDGAEDADADDSRTGSDEGSAESGSEKT